MQQFPLLEGIAGLPPPALPEMVTRGLERWAERARALDGEIADFASDFATHPAGCELLAAVFGNSPFLSRCLLDDLPFARTLASQRAEASKDALLADLAARRGTWRDRTELMRALRIARRRFALLTALADIIGAWTLSETTGALSAFAGAALGTVIAYLLSEAAAAGDLALANTEEPAESSGFFILGMGKLGARELNYSSDIDLIALYDQDVVAYTGAATTQHFFVRLTQAIVHILQSRTGEGYVFRTDLRLRPDAGATPLALSTAAAENYYESVGQNWERAAMIKARPVAGDLAAGDAFLASIRPFVWRKNLDFAAIADIHSIKRQIHAHRGHGEVTVAGHNIKLGRGGIREIEFFAQTQQLITGGRDARLRLRQTCGAIRALAESNRLSQAAANELTAAYEYLRRLEHRLQMVNDEQTHTLPADEEGLAHIAAFMGYAKASTLVTDLRAHLTKVVGHYGALFERAAPLGPLGNLVFTGIEDDPETLDTLENLGYLEAHVVSSRVRSWHHGRYRATRSVRARETLTALTPRILEALAGTANPDAAFVKFDEFLGRLPAGVQLFALFFENPGLLDLVAEIMGSAPRLADNLSHNTSLFDAVLSQGFFDPPPTKRTLKRDLDAALALARDYQDELDIARRFASQHKFQVGVQVLRNTASAAAASPALSGLADVLIDAMLVAVARDFAGQHGHIEGASMAVVGLGKLGARELTAASDLDLVFLYEAATGAERSDGPKPLALNQYFSRLSQRFIASLTAPTGEGRLYEVDMRLRPAGAAGPIASHVAAFAKYERTTAWTWEHMALTRARVVAAPAPLRARIGRIIRAVLTRRADTDRLLADVAEMRRRVAQEHGTDNPWTIKHVRGGLVDVEFLCQYLQLRHAADHPSVLCATTAEAYRRLGAAGIIPSAVAGELAAASTFLHNIQGFLRLTVEHTFDVESASEGLHAALARAGGAHDVHAVRSRLLEVQQAVYGRFRDYIEVPASIGGAT